jgi:hypothetical protein
LNAGRRAQGRIRGRRRRSNEVKSMINKTPMMLGLVAAIFSGAATVVAETGGKTPAVSPAKPGGTVSYNQKFIDGLYAKLDLNNEMAVFAHIFRGLPDKVVVYPTENYFYWSFTANGRVIWGNVRLDAGDRDKGIIHIGYFEYDENGKFQDYDGWGKKLTAKDGVTVKKVARLVYAVTYKDKTVTFQLNDIGMAPPKKAKLRADEVYVGPVFDESGVKFFLLFNKTENHFLYILNDEGPPAETYKDFGKRVVVGRRTGFAYYRDTPNTRKVLVAINGNNAKRNNYYDGPFDQLPDNYVDQTNIRKYMELAYPHVKGRINKYGVVKDEKGNRTLVGAYYIYNEEGELRFVESCIKTHGQTAAKLYSCIAPDNK